MSVLALAAAFTLAVVLAAIAGPLLLRRSAPLLVRTPRLAIVVLAGTILLWPAALLSIGPLAAWLLSGPTILPEGAAAVCQRCISAANPFGAEIGTGPVPTILLLALPAAAAVALGAAVTVQLRSRVGELMRATESVSGESRVIAGHRVTVVADDQLLAFSLPGARGGVVLSTGALAALEQSELAAVLAHERAHVRQCHHWIMVLTDSISTVLTAVPLVREARRILPDYLEIAADRAAQRAAGTTAVVSALLTLGERGAGARDGALHMAGPERVRQLVAPAHGRAGALPAAVMVSLIAVLAALTAFVLAPYSAALAVGCV